MLVISGSGLERSSDRSYSFVWDKRILSDVAALSAWPYSAVQAPQAPECRFERDSLATHGAGRFDKVSMSIRPTWPAHSLPLPPPSRARGGRDMAEMHHA